MAGEIIRENCLVSYKHSFVPDLLRDRVAFITGGGSGIGFRIAEILMRHGCDTVIASRSKERVEDAAKTLSKATGRRCLALTMDVRQPREIQDAIDKTLSYFGKLDIVINNAAGNFLCPLSNLTFNALKTVLEIDTMGTFNTSKIVFDKWFKEHGGVILNISATIGYRGDAFVGHAGAAKAAIDTLTKHMAVEWGQYGIRVMSIAPGFVDDTEGMRRLGGPVKELLSEAVSRVPIGRWCDRTEIAETVLFLVSDTGSLMTGGVVVCDGGNWLTASTDIHRLGRVFAMNSKL